MNWTYFSVDIQDHVAHVAFNRPEKANSLHMPMWEEMRAIFEHLHQEPEARVIVLSGEGKHFCAGIDLELLMSLQSFNQTDCEGRKREQLRGFIFKLQDCITAIEKCRKPVMAAIHGACVGGAVDIVSACDMRYATEDAYFSIKEIDLGLVADIGTLQRLPTILQPGMVAEMAYTGRKVFGPEAAQIGLTNRCFADKAQMMEAVLEIAGTIAAKSPLCIRGTKEVLLYKRDHSVEDSLNYMVAWNASMLMSKDLMESFQAHMMKRKPVYDN
ncbi:crotonase/enoyl-CoA hydratase family protein [Pontibacter sp. G13]|uniref:crotonase/enoyl-CoA hydratase family protein n=1 Tax=Pontibacter sp. G13 TaxID=3074898 RepID=UPI00288C4C0F|nr:crotonase/enoyl-CoA hydratase family protein [Pontibacter sp. G13]WNJ20002.1 crotonase/enoyl-CoA hydratase family protein [Pontibacter sp. G13]